MSNSLLRRYTQPTCRLQILARSSPVSRWVGQSVPAQPQFELCLDDLQLPEQQQVVIQGDRDQLEALHEAVTTYVQNLLNQSPRQFNAVFSALASSSPNAALSSTSEEPQQLDPFYASAHLVDPVTSPQEPTIAPGREIFLQPGNGLTHELFLGSLATQESGQVIQLSMLQLFDLATALDEYAADGVVPTPSRSGVTAGPSAWASIAAVLLLAVGLTTAIVTLNRSDSQQQIAKRNVTQGSSSKGQQPTPLQSSPIPTLGVPTPPLSSPENLPSLPPTGSFTASPSPSIPTNTVPGQATALPSIPPGPTLQTTPVDPIPRITPAPPILVSPVPRQDSAVPIPKEAPTPRTSITPTPSFSISPPSAAIPIPRSSPPQPNQETASSEAPSNAPPAESSDTPAGQQGRDSASQQSRSLPPTPNEPKGIAFNNVPQVAEAKDYFKQRWEPPSSLKQTLEYSLILDVDGTIQRIEPLGEAARKYVDRTGMPLIGERFVSQNKYGQTPRIRVVLAPDGKVQTFLEEYEKPSSPPRSPNNRGRLEGANPQLRDGS